MSWLKMLDNYGIRTLKSVLKSEKEIETDKIIELFNCYIIKLIDLYNYRDVNFFCNST